MKKSLETRQKQTLPSLAALLLLAAAIAPASAHDTEPTPFTMTVISDAAHGNRITSGKYEQAIDRITRNGRRQPSRFADHVNLCVAYAKTKKIDKALSACEAAISEAKEQQARAAKTDHSPEARAYRTDLALALSNRGVLLAATGREKRAEKDFLTAIDLKTALTSIVENNLERLGRETAS